MHWHFQPMGESALLAEPQAADPDTANALVHGLAAELARSAVRGIQQPIPGAASLLIPFDPAVLETAAVEQAVLHAVSRAGAQPSPAGRLHVLEVRYGGNDGPDLAEVAVTLGISQPEVVALHCTTVYRVLLLGFAPGFAYLGGLPPPLHVPRRPNPRVGVPAGSVAIAADYSGVYPSVLPGGWHILGRCAAVLFDPHAQPPALLSPGDQVRFEPLPAGVVP